MDVRRALVVKQRFTNAVDAAALTVGRQLGRDDPDIRGPAQGFINALQGVFANIALGLNQLRLAN